MLGHSETQNRKERIEGKWVAFLLQGARGHQGDKTEAGSNEGTNEGPLMSVTVIAAHPTVPAAYAKY